MSSAQPDPTGIDIPTQRLYYTHRQVEDTKHEIASLESTLSDPRARLESRAEVSKALHRLRSDLHNQAPPDTTGDQRDRLAREEKELLAKIVPDMPSQEEMRKCPPGAIGKHLNFEKAHKRNILRLKNIQRVLNRGNEDPDISNLERYRGTKSTLNMDNALIPGKQHFIPPATQEYKEGWERTFGNGEASGADVAALLKRIDDLEKRVSAKPVDHAKEPRAEQPMVLAKCGHECKGSFGKQAHERQCISCKSIVQE